MDEAPIAEFEFVGIRCAGSDEPRADGPQFRRTGPACRDHIRNDVGAIRWPGAGGGGARRLRRAPRASGRQAVVVRDRCRRSPDIRGISRDHDVVLGKPSAGRIEHRRAVREAFGDDAVARLGDDDVGGARRDLRSASRARRSAFSSMHVHARRESAPAACPVKRMSSAAGSRGRPQIEAAHAVAAERAQRQPGDRRETEAPPRLVAVVTSRAARRTGRR